MYVKNEWKYPAAVTFCKRIYYSDLTVDMGLDDISIENLPVQYRKELLPYIQQALQHPVFDLNNAIPMQKQ